MAEIGFSKLFSGCPASLSYPCDHSMLFCSGDSDQEGLSDCERINTGTPKTESVTSFSVTSVWLVCAL